VSGASAAPEIITRKRAKAVTATELTAGGAAISPSAAGTSPLGAPVIGSSATSTPVAGTAVSGIAVTGTVVVIGSTVPLAGVRVTWTARRSGRTGGNSRAAAVELGTAASGPDGLFRIQLSEAPAAQEAYALMRAGAPFESHVVAEDRSGPISKPVPVSAGPGDLIVEVEGAKAPDKAALKAVATYLSVNRRLVAGDLIGELRNPSTGSPTAGISPGARAEALRALLQTTAQEAAAVAASLDGIYQGAFVDTAALAAGNLGRAITRDHGVVGALTPRPGGAFARESTTALYRDYLRATWVAAAQNMFLDISFVGGPGPVNAPAATLEAQLDARFHQDFHTGDDVPQPAAKLLVKLLTSALLAPANREGFGLAPAAIPPQGAQSDDVYLAVLIGRTKATTQELRNRYRVSFERAPGDAVSPVQLNVEALLGLLADTFQSPEEPFPATPVIVEGKPLIFRPYDGRAPFFLEYEEWLTRNDRFYPENVFDIRAAVPSLDAAGSPTLDAAYRGTVKRYEAPYAPGFKIDWNFDDPANDTVVAAKWLEAVFPILDAFADIFHKIDAQTYPVPRDFDDLEARIATALGAWSRRIKQWGPPTRSDRFYWLDSNGIWNDTPDRLVSLQDRSTRAVTTPEELAAFEGFFAPPRLPYSGLEENVYGIAKANMLFQAMLTYAKAAALPYLRASVSVAKGDYATAIRYLSPLTGYEVGVAEASAKSPYNNTPGGLDHNPKFYQDFTLPYTTAVSYTPDVPPALADVPPFGGVGGPVLAPFEQRFFRLVQGDAMLAWADELYRNDDPSSIRRARELYKGVLFMHQVDPAIAPTFAAAGPLKVPMPLWLPPDNPAKTSQVARARMALYQIENGLNAYGYRDDMVPVLRYKPLKQAADLFAASAKAAQADFLQYQTRFEQAQIDVWQARDLVARSTAMAGIAGEQIAIAKDGVDKAQAQVKAVQDQIAAKQKEIADKNSLFSQFSDFFGGIKDSVTSLVPLAQKVAADDGAASSVSGADLLGILEKGASGGGSAAKDAAVDVLGSGAGLAVGFVAFAYTGYSSMQSMADAYAKRDDDLKSLQTVALPAAQAQVRLKQRDVAIAQYGQQIAQADLDYANQLWRFQQDRFLNAEFWHRLARFANQLMRGYIEMGARAAWQAERALAYEQARVIRIVRMNYFPHELRGVTGPDQLQADLAALEATRLQGVRLTTPVKHTISLAREFPIAFAALKKAGTCRFRPDESALRSAYPGTYGHRIRAVTVAAYDPQGPAPRGILCNHGVSLVGAEDAGATKTLVRFPDALALSEFRLHDDLFVYGLPGETLLQFEGSGFTTEWRLDFLPSANPRGLASLADVLITFDTNALYSESLAEGTMSAAPAPVNRAVALAASVWDPKGLRTLRGPGASAQMTFDPSRLGLPAQEKARTLSNLAVICAGITTQSYTAKLTASAAAKQASFTIKDGVALSNAGPLLGSAAALPLNAVTGVSLDQPFVLAIDRSGAVADELAKLYDVVLYLEYTATM